MLVMQCYIRMCQIVWAAILLQEINIGNHTHLSAIKE